MTAQSINSQAAAALPRPQQKVTLDHNDPLTKQAEMLVAQTFFGTLLREARQSPFHSDMFDGGKGGKAFGEMFDQKIAEHMTHGAGAKLVHSLIRKFHSKPEYKSVFGKGKKQSSASMLGNALRTTG